jgi:hypothetical protein
MDPKNQLLTNLIMLDPGLGFPQSIGTIVLVI